jgi:hypothetical protein
MEQLANSTCVGIFWLSIATLFSIIGMLIFIYGFLQREKEVRELKAEIKKIRGE